MHVTLLFQEPQLQCYLFIIEEGQAGQNASGQDQYLPLVYTITDYQ